MNKKAQSQTIEQIPNWAIVLIFLIVLTLIIVGVMMYAKSNISSTKCEIKPLGVTGTCLNQTEASKSQLELSYTCINDSNICKEKEKNYCCYSMNDLGKTLDVN